MPGIFSGPHPKVLCRADVRLGRPGHPHFLPPSLFPRHFSELTSFKKMPAVNERTTRQHQWSKSTCNKDGRPSKCCWIPSYNRRKITGCRLYPGAEPRVPSPLSPLHCGGQQTHSSRAHQRGSTRYTLRRCLRRQGGGASEQDKVRVLLEFTFQKCRHGTHDAGSRSKWVLSNRRGGFRQGGWSREVFPKLLGKDWK